MSSNGLSSTITPTDSSPAIYQVRQAMKVLKASALSKSNSDSSYVYNLGWSFDSMIISCYFNGNKCNSSSFDRFYSFEYGNCYTFNKKTTTSTSLRTTSKTGPTNGLSLEIFTGYPGNKIGSILLPKNMHMLILIEGYEPILIFLVKIIKFNLRLIYFQTQGSILT